MRKILFTLTVFALCFAAHGQKITSLTEATAATDASLMIVRSASSGNVLNRMTVANIFKDRTLTGTTVLPATTSIGTVDATELSYVNGATANIQSQLNDTVSLSIGVPFIVLTPSASPPGSPVEGMIYMDTDHHLYVYNNTTWVQLDN